MVCLKLILYTYLGILTVLSLVGLKPHVINIIAPVVIDSCWLFLQTSEPPPHRGSRKVPQQLKEAATAAEDKSSTSGDVSITCVEIV